MSACGCCTPFAGCATRPDGQTQIANYQPSKPAIEPHIHMHNTQVLSWEGSARSFTPITALGNILRVGALPSSRRAAPGRWGAVQYHPPFFDFASTSHRAWIAHEAATFPIIEGPSRARL